MVRYTFGDIFDLYAGGDVDRSHYSPVKYGKYTIPIYANALQNHGLYGFTDKARYPNNSVTISGRGDIGHAEYRSEAFDAIIRLLVLVPKKENTVDCRYFAELVNTYIKFPSESTGVPQLTTVQIKNIEFSLPEYDEQRAIATALSDTDALIDSLEKLIAKKQAIKQGAMQELLTGKRRLKGFSGEWNYRNFVDTFDFLPNNTYSRDKMTNSVGEYINIHYGDVLIKYGAILDLEKDEPPYLAEGVKITNKKMLARDGDIIIADTAEDNTVGKMIELLHVGKQKVVSGLHTILCRPKYDEFSPRWLGYFMNSESYHEQLLPFITGIKVSSVAKSSIGETIISIPDKEEQQAIAQILTDMDDEISALQKKLDKVRRIKQGMMAELLTGRIRLI